MVLTSPISPCGFREVRYVESSARNVCCVVLPVRYRLGRSYVRLCALVFACARPEATNPLRGKNDTGRFLDGRRLYLRWRAALRECGLPWRRPASGVSSACSVCAQCLCRPQAVRAAGAAHLFRMRARTRHPWEWAPAREQILRSSSCAARRDSRRVCFSSAALYL